MAYEYSDLVTDVEGWAQQAEIAGWIDKQQASSLVEEQQGDANSLFTEQTERPLVVAFMGGTGVGKSSLLNKLAGQSIAKTGVERPTSREVTLFHHQSISLNQLEDKFPLQQIQLAQHTKESNKNVLWIDMPDFDSTEEKNKDIVMQWLPYVDVLIYVVSPERYKDNKAWQLLLSEGENHAWLFAMNQWDRGVDAQYDDFKAQLAKAGFANPIIYKTICLEQQTSHPADELKHLEGTIESLATDKTVEQLQIRAYQQRNYNLKVSLQQCLQTLGDKQVFSKLLDYQQDAWSQTETVLKKGFEWPLKQASEVYSKTQVLVKQEKIKLWDEWAQSRLNDHIDDLILSADHQGLPSLPLRKNLIETRANAEKIVHSQTELGCRQALIHPGNLLQRIFLKFMAICEIVLPLIAMGIVGFQVFYGYYDSATSNESFLGLDFAIHSVLLILLSWLIPYFINKKMQPSLEKAAFKGLENGLDAALARIELDVKQVIKSQTENHKQITGKLKDLINACDKLGVNVNNKPSNEKLTRMLVEKETEALN